MTATFSSALDRHFGIHAPALQFRSERSRVLAANLANADTPDYQARDLDFAAVLASREGLASGGRSPDGSPMAATTLRTTHARHLSPGSGAGGGAGSLLYRNPYQPTLDGNTVEAEVEQANFARNAIEYQASLMFLTGKIRGLRDAIQGGQ